MTPTQMSSVADADPGGTDPRPLTAIINDLWEKLEYLVRQEMRLGITEAEEKADVLKQELEERAGQLKMDLGAMAVGGTVAFAGLLALVSALILLLARVMPAWSAALIVGVVLSGAGVLLLKRKPRTKGVNARELVPQRTLDSLKQDAQRITEAMK